MLAAQARYHHKGCYLPYIDSHNHEVDAYTYGFGINKSNETTFIDIVAFVS